ncbi:MAG: helix-hairpin-helix domain-containing protein [Chitinophagales bacterium]
MKKFIKEYFTFSRRERNGVLVLLILIAITLVLPYTYPYLIPSEKTDFSEFEADVKRFREAVAANANKSNNEYDDEKWTDKEDDIDEFGEKENKAAFDFNPNELTYEQGKALGLSHKIALRITKYLKAGGHFYKKEDLKKIYDFSDEDYERLAPFAIIEKERGLSRKKKSYKQKDFEGKKDEKHFKKKKFEESEIPIEVKLFPFDPNKVTYDEGRQLGLSNKAAKALVNFVKKGMVFRKKEDFKKVYGVTESDYQRLQNFIHIESKEAAIADEKGEEGTSKSERQRPETFRKFEEKDPISVDINTATAEDWKQLKGIGNSFSSRIIKYRDLLGGFTNPLQLKEVYGLDAILYVEIQDFLKNESPESIKTININLADELALKKHPYIDAKLAKSIVKRRIRKGDYQSIEDIQKIGGVDSALFQKLSPYLNVR